jgi:hypothetical protein
MQLHEKMKDSKRKHATSEREFRHMALANKIQVELEPSGTSDAAQYTDDISQAKHTSNIISLAPGLSDLGEPYLALSYNKIHRKRARAENFVVDEPVSAFKNKYKPESLVKVPSSTGKASRLEASSSHLLT